MRNVTGSQRRHEDNSMERFVTFTLYEPDPDEIFCLSEEEFHNSLAETGEGIPEDCADFIWQFAPNKETAKTQHFDKLDWREKWLNDGGPEKRTY